MVSKVEEPIAIIGSACRFPGGCSTPSKLWELLREPRDVRKHFDPRRLNLNRFHNVKGQTHGSTDVRGLSYLLEEDTRVFDAGFFGISPAVASGMDPQQRILLEVSYEACESAGVTLDSLRGSQTSVHIGSMSNDYGMIQARDPETMPKYHATGSFAPSIIANRVSYVFDLKGPSVSIDTACSSSLVALHQAVEGLRAGDCDAAIVGGTNLIMDPVIYIVESKLQMLSPDSQCRMWDASANGYGRGEGVAALLLKPLSRALAAGDPIQGVIRATGVNSDGQSQGITMPFAPAQTDLIRRTYRRAGLDPLREADRPQYFECHGTGTQAGDPVEARAVYDVFFQNPAQEADSELEQPDGERPKTLVVGSIKTVIGHTEGCAGLAGVIKVLLMLKHQVVPPNMLFDQLNPKIAPFYGPGALEIATKQMAWPARPAGTPMRASVNSFGFGGTNAHAIIEALPTTTCGQAEASGGRSSDGTIGPLLFSAESGPALLRNVQAYVEYAEKQADSLDIRDLSRVLQTHRTTHRVRTFFTGKTKNEVLNAMAQFVASHSSKGKSGGIGSIPRLMNPAEAPGILGIFTGQGAQWATMGRELIAASPLFRRSLEECEAVLRSHLPAGHGHAPTWSLIDELSRETDVSRLGEAELAQPLCTALQIAQVDLLAASGIRFGAVVGHSSGEIVATYAAGLISREAAMQIAYYRGFYAYMARAGTEVGGGMLAVGLPLQAASELCRQPQFVGRLVVAASNAPQSCTLSGDRDAVDEAREQLERENVFARPLLVDTAYHSHHMEKCADAYLQALLACKIDVKGSLRRGQDACVWSSSVRGDAHLLRQADEAELVDSLKGPYWVANMVQMVKFSQALESAVSQCGPFDVAIELGPHPALKGPVEQTLKATCDSSPRYASLLRRKTSDVMVVQEAIGSLWEQLGSAQIDWKGYRGIWGDSPTASTPPVVADLPGYHWDHDRVYWRESRMSARYRTLADTPHELLGRRMADDNDHELRWRNVLRVSEIPWLAGHEVMGEVLLPGAAYVSIAAQAAQDVARGRPVARLAVENVEILRPVVIPDNAEGVEALFTVQILPAENRTAEAQVVRARFAYYISSDESTGAMMHTCRGMLVIDLGPASPSTPAYKFPSRESIADGVHIDGEAIYDMFDKMRLDYKGPFVALKSCQRSHWHAATTAVWPAEADLDAEALSLGPCRSSYVLHPVILDAAFQSLFVAYTHPTTHLLKRAMLQKTIGRVLIDPHVPVVTPHAATSPTTCYIDAWINEATADTLDGEASLYVHGDAGSRPFAQVEGLGSQAGGVLDASQDRDIFCRTARGHDISLMGLTLPARHPMHDERMLRINEATERLALWYMRRLLDDVQVPAPVEGELDQLQPHHRRMLAAFAHHLGLVRRGQHPTVRTAWLTDAPEDIAALDREHGDTVEFRLMHAVGGALARTVLGEAHLLLAVMREDDLLNRYYMQNSTSVATNRAVGQLMKQITFKFPRCNMLELGAGTGGTTWSVLNAVDDLYDSYTFTDVSPAFLPAAAEKFAAFPRVAYRKLDIEQDIAGQGFAPYSYDVIIASNVLHVTRSLDEVLARTRTLLRPGGYLVLLETTGAQSMVDFIFGGLPGWWLSKEPSRQLGPLVSPLEWHRLLQGAGFSGADAVVHDSPDESRHVTSCIVSQAVDSDMLRLRSPLDFVAPDDLPTPPSSPLLLIGGQQLGTIRLVDAVTRLLPASWRTRLRVVPSIDALDLDGYSISRADVICLHDIDKPLFATLPMPESRLQRLQHLFMSASNLLWVTAAGTSAPARAGMIRGITRVVPKELPHLSTQVLGLEAGASAAVDARRCVEALLRLRHMADLREGGGQSPRPLWSIEPECEVSVTGEVCIARVMPARALNERFASRSRPIIKMTNPRDFAVQALSNANGRIELRRFVGHSQGAVPMEISYALHIPSSELQPSVYLVCGRTEAGWSMALSSANVSRSLFDRAQLAHVDSSRCTPPVMRAMTDALLRYAAIQSLKSHATKVETGSEFVVLLLNPAQHLAEKLKEELKAAINGVKVFCVASTATEETSPNWILIPADASRRAVKQYLPHGIGSVIDFSGNLDPPGTGVQAHLKACLPPSCQRLSFNGDLLQRILPHQLESKSEKNTFQVLCESAMAMEDVRESRALEVIEAADLAGKHAPALSVEYYICDWRSQSALPLTVQPPEADVGFQGILRPDRTYVIMGGSGGLGISLTRWMIRQGAQHIVVTSRRAQPNVNIQDEARRAGAAVHYLAVDVTQREQVDNAVMKVRETMPPIAGVCNLPMVLHDSMFLDMSADQLNETLAAKVIGTENLDAVFHQGAEPLDFFIVASSAASVIGNMAQANYHAGNLFMDAVVAGRRAKGLAASVVHIGWVADTGYITRFAKEKQLGDHLRSTRLTPLSETDVQDAFAMAVRASRVNYGSDAASDIEHDITMGLAPPTAPLQPGHVSKAIWTSDPRLMALHPYSVLSSDSQQQRNQHGDARSKGVSVRERIVGAETEDEAVSIAAAAFGAKLETILQLPPGAVHENNGLERPIIDLGIDSLVAVEIRTWCLKELNTEVPILKILGGVTVLQVSVNAANKVLDDHKKLSPKRATTEESDNMGRAKEIDSQVPTGSADSSSVSVYSPSDSGSEIKPPTTLVSETDDEIEVEKDVVPDPVITREAPMSAAQSRFWFAHRHMGSPAACNNVFHFRVRGRIDPIRLRHALRVVADHHECIRTCYYPHLEDGHPMQGIAAPSEWALRLAHTEHAQEGIESALRQTLTDFKTHAWDLERGQTMAVALLSLKNETTRDESAKEYGYLVHGYHHITLDGWSAALFWRDVDRAYRLQSLTPLGPRLSYVDYSLQQLGEESTGVLDEDLAFWRTEFASSLPDTLPLLPMALGPDRLSLARQHKNYQSPHDLSRELSPSQLEAVKSLSQRLRISPFHVYLALLQVLLARLAGIDDVCVGVIDANRRDDRFVETLGCFVNVLPVRATLPSSSSTERASSGSDFATIARAASRKSMSVFAHGTVPFDRILDVAAAPRATEAHPLCQAAINYRTSGAGIWDLPLGAESRLHLSWDNGKEADNPYDISLGFFETPTGCLAQIWCSAALYGPDACHSILDMYLRLLENVASDPSVSVHDLSLYDGADPRVLRAIEAGRGPETHFDWSDTMSGTGSKVISQSLSIRVRDTCRLYPDQTAVTDAGGSVSYAQLASRTTQLAERLKEANISARQVAVLCEPSVDGIVAMLAILEAGGVYVPLDVSLPAFRHADMLQLCTPALVLFHAPTKPRVKALLDASVSKDQIRAVQMDRDFSHDNTHCDDINNDQAPLQSGLTTPSFLLFTSGSTGTPNGVLLTQANFANSIALHTQDFDINLRDCVLQQSSLGFDMSIVQTFSALTNGARLVIAPSDIRRDPVGLAALVRHEEVSMTIATPTEYLAWMHAASDELAQAVTWRLVFSGGEPVPLRLTVELHRLGIPGMRLTNCYGPTEITAAATFQHIPLTGEVRESQDTSCVTASDGNSAIWRPFVVGKAITNYSVCIIDVFGSPLPIGHMGEICIGGAGVALGYFNRPELTRTRFLTGIPGMTGTVYRTGDKGRLLANGTLLCLGRIDGDTQIKLRGQRIDLQEVEAAILSAAGGTFASVVVSQRRLDGSDVLIAHAFLDSRSNASDNIAADVLARIRLPQAFVPVAIYILEKMPTTPNGKLDRKAIARLSLPESNPDHGAECGGKGIPEKTVEKLTVRQGELRLLWERVLPALGDKRLGPSSDFFLCGGNSLLLMKLQRAIKETTGVEISTKRMYDATTLRAMAHAVFEGPEARAGLEDNTLIDWDAETAVPVWLHDQIEQVERNPSSAGKSEGESVEVLLTGGASFPGRQILTALAHHPAVRKVHCIAMPSDRHNAQLPRPDSPAEVVYYSGSILSPTLGLTATERDTLTQKVDVIIHTGAHGHCLNRFATLRRPNVESLHVLASIALRRSIPLLFLSSPRCLLLAGDTAICRPPASLREFKPPVDGSDGYTASKWTGEVFLENLADQVRQRETRTGLQIAIHRSCPLVSDSNSDAMNSILRYSVAMRCVPRFPHTEGFVDFAPLDVVVPEIVSAALALARPTVGDGDSASAASSTVSFRHHSGGVKTPYAQFRAHMETVYGGEFEEVGIEEWLVRAGQRGLDPLITAYIEALLENGRPLKSAYLGAKWDDGEEEAER